MEEAVARPSGPDPGPPSPRRVWAWLTLGIFLLPLAAVGMDFLEQRIDFRVAERAAEEQFSRRDPSPGSWRVLGEARLDEGRLGAALPLLTRAAALERPDGGARSILLLATAEIAASRAGVPGADLGRARECLRRAEARAGRMPPARRAAVVFSAGVLWGRLGSRRAQLRDLREAVALSRRGAGVGVGGPRAAGLAEYYQTMLAGALER